MQGFVFLSENDSRYRFEGLTCFQGFGKKGHGDLAFSPDDEIDGPMFHGMVGKNSGMVPADNNVACRIKSFDGFGNCQNFLKIRGEQGRNPYQKRPGIPGGPPDMFKAVSEVPVMMKQAERRSIRPAVELPEIFHLFGQI